MHDGFGENKFAIKPSDCPLSLVAVDSNLPSYQNAMVHILFQCTLYESLILKIIFLPGQFILED